MPPTVNSSFVTSRLRLGLGTFIAIDAEADSAAASEQGLRAGFAAVAFAENLLHPTRPGSDLAALNQSPPGVQGVHEWTWMLLDLCKRLNRLSQGVFDPCVPGSSATLADLELLPREAGTRPSVVLHARLTMDLGGIGKGFAVDRAVDAIRAAGCHAGLVNAGGDLAVFGDRGHAMLYRDRRGAMASITLRNAAMAASDVDNAARPAEHRGYYSGIDANCVVAGRVAITAPSAAAADGLTKCLLVDGAANSSLLEALGARQIV
ncbi:MAG: FAD:protein transferase [Gammaproteobacteria bacterium]|nr:FAD:protein transferase [Gammaproteobacteria bacterium]